jgi:hypothetical protein
LLAGLLDELISLDQEIATRLGKIRRVPPGA